MKKQYETDVALLSVTMTEFRAVMHFHDWKARTFPDGEQSCVAARFGSSGRERLPVHAKIAGME